MAYTRAFWDASMCTKLVHLANCVRWACHAIWLAARHLGMSFLDLGVGMGMWHSHGVYYMVATLGWYWLAVGHAWCCGHAWWCWHGGVGTSATTNGVGLGYWAFAHFSSPILGLVVWACLVLVLGAICGAFMRYMGGDA